MAIAMIAMGVTLEKWLEARGGEWMRWLLLLSLSSLFFFVVVVFGRRFAPVCWFVSLFVCLCLFVCL